jgi:hypothetical protein
MCAKSDERSGAFAIARDYANEPLVKTLKRAGNPERRIWISAFGNLGSKIHLAAACEHGTT